LIFTLLEVFDAAAYLDEAASLDDASLRLAIAGLGPPVLFESAFCYGYFKSFSVCWPTSDANVCSLYYLPCLEEVFSSLIFIVFLDIVVISLISWAPYPPALSDYALSISGYEARLGSIVLSSRNT